MNASFLETADQEADIDDVRNRPIELAIRNLLKEIQSLTDELEQSNYQMQSSSKQLEQEDQWKDLWSIHDSINALRRKLQETDSEIKNTQAYLSQIVLESGKLRMPSVRARTIISTSQSRPDTSPRRQTPGSTPSVTPRKQSQKPRPPSPK